LFSWFGRLVALVGFVTFGLVWLVAWFGCIVGLGWLAGWFCSVWFGLVSLVG